MTIVHERMLLRERLDSGSHRLSWWWWKEIIRDNIVHEMLLRE
jgi:hypothetical protein